MVLSRYLVAVLALVAMFATAEARTFTSTDGRTLEAEVVGVTKDSVLLKLGAGGVRAVPVHLLSAPDLDYLVQWEVEERKRKPASVSVTIKKNTNAGKETSFGLEKSSATEVVYTLTVRNTSRRPVTNLTIDVAKEVESNTTGGRGGRLKDSRADANKFAINRLETNEEQTLRCSPIILIKRVTFDKIVYTDVSTGRKVSEELRATKNEDRIKNFAVQVSGEGRVLWKN